jgi:hypothetical protein
MSELNPHKTSTARAFIVYIFNGGVGVTGEAANFTKTVFKDQAYQGSPPTVTITEIDSTNAKGAYKVSYTPDADGDWQVWIKHPTYDPTGSIDTIKCKSKDLWDPQELGEAVLVATVDNTNNIESSYQKATLLDVIQRICNKVSRSGSSTITVYKKNDSTVWKIDDITTDGALLPIASADPQA